MASTMGDQETVGEKNATEDNNLGNHLTFYASQPQLQITTPPFQPPPTAEQLDQILRPKSTPQYGLLGARDSTYIKTFVLLLSWEETDPKLIVDAEINRVHDVFENLYHFQVKRWKIPSEDPHLNLNERILDFVRLGDDRKDCLKIVYYAGHGKLSRNRQPMWTDHRGRSVVWGGIQNVLEQAKSDVLILIDSCSAGAANTDQGRGVTELVAAGGFNVIANGVGPWSFTYALVVELRLLSRGQPFTISRLYNRIVSRMQNQIPDEEEHHEYLGLRPKERFVPPIHVVLTEDHLCISRRIQLLPTFRSLSTQPETLEFIEISQSTPSQESTSLTRSQTATFDSKFASQQTEVLSPMPGSIASSHEVDAVSSQRSLEENIEAQISTESSESLLLEIKECLNNLENNFDSRFSSKTQNQRTPNSDDGLEAILLRVEAQIHIHRLIYNSPRSPTTTTKLPLPENVPSTAKYSNCKSDVEARSSHRNIYHQERLNLVLSLIITLGLMSCGPSLTHVLWDFRYFEKLTTECGGFMNRLSLFIHCCTSLLGLAILQYLMSRARKIPKSSKVGEKSQQAQVKPVLFEGSPLGKIYGCFMHWHYSDCLLCLAMVVSTGLVVSVLRGSYSYEWVPFSQQLQIQVPFITKSEPKVGIAMDSTILQLHPETTSTHTADDPLSTLTSPELSWTINLREKDSAIGTLPMCAQTCIVYAILGCSCTIDTPYLSCQSTPAQHFLVSEDQPSCECPEFVTTAESCITSSCPPSFYQPALDLIACPREKSSVVDSALSPEKPKPDIPSPTSYSLGHKFLVATGPSTAEASKATLKNVISTTTVPTMTNSALPNITPAPVPPVVSCSDDTNCLGSSVCVYGASTCFLYSYATLGMSCSGDVYDCADPWLCIGGVCTTELLPVEVSTVTTS